MNTLVLSTGSNLGDRKEILESARAEIGQCLGNISKCSGIYESASWGYESKNHFYNQCLVVKTDKDLGDCFALILEIEEKFGRERLEAVYQDRNLDIDILFYNEIIMDTEHMQVPHPRLHMRKFVLIPLAEIHPEMLHPVFRKTIRELLEDCEDTVDVHPLKNEKY